MVFLPQSFRLKMKDVGVMFGGGLTRETEQAIKPLLQ